MKENVTEALVELAAAVRILAESYWREARSMEADDCLTRVNERTERVLTLLKGVK